LAKHKNLGGYGGRTDFRSGPYSIHAEHAGLPYRYSVWHVDLQGMTLTLRLPITRTQIGHVVAVFYHRVQVRSVLGPTFVTHVTDWSLHEAKITDFWANAILHERVYEGNPMKKHMQAGHLEPDHFRTWLAIFDDILQAELSSDVAQRWSALAHRIGRGLQYGLQAQKGGIPVL
jgi:hemoglobin